MAPHVPYNARLRELVMSTNLSSSQLLGADTPNETPAGAAADGTFTRTMEEEASGYTVEGGVDIQLRFNEIGSSTLTGSLHAKVRPFRRLERFAMGAPANIRVVRCSVNGATATFKHRNFLEVVYPESARRSDAFVAGAKQYHQFLDAALWASEQEGELSIDFPLDESDTAIVGGGGGGGTPVATTTTTATAATTTTTTGVVDDTSAAAQDTTDVVMADATRVSDDATAAFAGTDYTDDVTIATPIATATSTSSTLDVSEHTAMDVDAGGAAPGAGAGATTPPSAATAAATTTSTTTATNPVLSFSLAAPAPVLTKLGEIDTRVGKDVDIVIEFEVLNIGASGKLPVGNEIERKSNAKRRVTFLGGRGISAAHLHWALPSVQLYPGRFPHVHSGPLTMFSPYFRHLCRHNITVAVSSKLSVAAPSLSVCCGDFVDVEENVRLEKTLSDVYKFVSDTAARADSVGLTIGPYVALPDPNLPNVTHFCLPGRESDMAYTVEVVSHAAEFYTSYFGSSLPFGSYKQVFVEEAYAPGQSFASMGVFGVDQLLNPSIVDEVYGVRRELVLALAEQWFGHYLLPKRREERWITVGFAEYLKSLFLIEIEGVTAHQHDVCADAQLISALREQDQIVLSSVEATHAVEDESHLYRKKCGLVMYMLARQLGAEGMRAVMIALLADARADKMARMLSQKTLIRTAKRVTGKDLRRFFGCYVNSPFNPRLKCGFWFNRKKGQLEVAVQQLPDETAVVDNLLVGKLNVRVTETDGVYDYSLPLNDAVQFCDLPLNSKKKRTYVKKNAKEAGAGDVDGGGGGGGADGAAASTAGSATPAGASLTAPRTNLVERELGKNDTVLQWVRFDPAFDLAIGRLAWRQPEFMWLAQLQRDLDVVAQLTALDGVLAFPRLPAVLVLDALMKNRKVYFKVRVRAAYLLASLAVEATAYHSATLLYKYAVDRLLDDRHVIMLHNDFSDIAQYRVNVGVVQALSVLPTASNLVGDVTSLFIKLLTENDNTTNEFADHVLVAELFYGVARLATIARSKVRAIRELAERYIAHDGIVPSFRNKVTAAALHCLCALMRRKLIKTDLEVFYQHVQYGHYTLVRLKSVQCILMLDEPLRAFETVMDVLHNNHLTLLDTLHSERHTAPRKLVMSLSVAADINDEVLPDLVEDAAEDSRGGRIGFCPPYFQFLAAELLGEFCRLSQRVKPLHFGTPSVSDRLRTTFELVHVRRTYGLRWEEMQSATDVVAAYGTLHKLGAGVQGCSKRFMAAVSKQTKMRQNLWTLLNSRLTSGDPRLRASILRVYEVLFESTRSFSISLAAIKETNSKVKLAMPSTPVVVPGRLSLSGSSSSSLLKIGTPTNTNTSAGGGGGGGKVAGGLRRASSGAALHSKRPSSPSPSSSSSSLLTKSSNRLSLFSSAGSKPKTSSGVLKKRESMPASKLRVGSSSLGKKVLSARDLAASTPAPKPTAITATATATATSPAAAAETSVVTASKAAKTSAVVSKLKKANAALAIDVAADAEDAQPNTKWRRQSWTSRRIGGTPTILPMRAAVAPPSKPPASKGKMGKRGKKDKKGKKDEAGGIGRLSLGLSLGAAKPSAEEDEDEDDEEEESSGSSSGSGSEDDEEDDEEVGEDEDDEDDDEEVGEEEDEGEASGGGESEESDEDDADSSGDSSSSSDEVVSSPEKKPVKKKSSKAGGSLLGLSLGGGKKKKNKKKKKKSSVGSDGDSDGSDADASVGEKRKRAGGGGFLKLKV